MFNFFDTPTCFQTLDTIDSHPYTVFLSDFLLYNIGNNSSAEAF